MKNYHIVLLKFKPDLEEELKARVLGEMMSLKNRCVNRSHKPYMTELVGGKGQALEHLQRGFEYGFIMSFESTEDLNFYASKDEVHQQFKDEYGGHLEDILVFDFIPGEFS